MSFPISISLPRKGCIIANRNLSTCGTVGNAVGMDVGLDVGLDVGIDVGRYDGIGVG